MRVTQNGLHASQLLCTAHKLFFVCCMRVIIRVLHNSKKHMSNASCTARESVFLCCMQVNCHLLPEKDQGMQQKSILAKRDKMYGHKENNILSSIYIPIPIHLDDIFIEPTECQT